MIKRIVCTLCAVVLTVAAGIPAMAASKYDYKFEAEEYEDFYPASEGKILHDGHGNFTAADTQPSITSADGYIAAIYPGDSITGGYPSYPGLWQNTDSAPPGIGGPYVSGKNLADQQGKIGELEISCIGLNCNVYEGESVSNLAKGAGHFTCTSAWNGNVGLAGHNRGSAAYFGGLKYLRTGDIVTYRTALGVRTYSVFSVRKIADTDFSPLNAAGYNMLTLITCVENSPSLRLCVQAMEI